MMTKTKKFGLSLLTLLVIVFAVSAVSATTLQIVVTDSPTTATHGTNTDLITFDVTYTGTADSVTLDFTDSDTNIGAWSGLPVGATLDKDETKTFSATINVPENAGGTINAVLDVETNTGAETDANVPAITIEEDSSLSINILTELTAAQDGVVEVENDGNTNLNSVILSKFSGDFDVVFSDNNFNLAAGETQTITVTASNLGDVGVEGKSVTIEAKSGDTIATRTLSISGTFCQAGKQGGNLKIKDIAIDNLGEGSDDEWQLLDTIEIEVEVENEGDDDIDDVFIEIGLFDGDGDNVIDDMDFENADEEEGDVGNLNDGDEETHTFTFRVPADIDDGNYKLTVKAYSDDLGEENECIDESNDLGSDTYESISIERESDEGRFIAFENIDVTPTDVTCGDRVTLTTEVYNIGDEDQDQVRVNLFNSEMGLSEAVEIRTDLDEGEKERVTFEFVVPDGLEDGSYTLRFNADYDYRNGNYRESSEEDTTYLLRVIGCAGAGPTPGERFVAITADLDSDAAAGEELVVRATLTNLETESMTFIVDATGFSSWASLDSISERVVDVGGGDSREVTFRFIVDEDASDEESFDIEVMSGNMLETREIAVNIEGAEAGPGFSLGDNAYLWIIGIVNVILIILIIIVAVRVLGK